MFMRNPFIGSAAIMALVLIAGFGVPVFCETKPISEKAEVSIVDLRVTVLDKDGKPVTDLKENEFKVKDNDTLQSLVAAQLVSSGVATTSTNTTASSAPQALHQPRHFLLLFDLTYNDMIALKNARNAALQFVQQDLVETDDASIFTIDITEGVKMHMNFTRDKEQLSDALLNLRSTKGNNFLTDSAGLVRIVPEARGNQLKGTWIRKGMTYNPKDAANDESQSYHQQVKRNEVLDYRNSAGKYLTCLDAFAQSIDTMPGRKIFLLFSSGFDSKALGGQTLQETEEDTMNFMMGEFQKMDSAGREVDIQNIDLLQQAASHFSTSDCRIFCIDPSGNRQTSADSDTPADINFRNQTLLETLSSETGGQVIRHTNSYEEALGHVIESTSSYYLLAYSAPIGKSGKYHSIDVEVTRPGCRVSHRKGYFEDRPFEKYTSLERQLQVAAIINEARSPAGISITTTAFQLPMCRSEAAVAPRSAENSMYSIEGIVELPVSVLADMGSKKDEDIEFFLFAISEKNYDVISYSHGLGKAPATPHTADDEALDTVRGGLRYLGVVAVPKGTYKILGIARNLITGVCAVGSMSLNTTPQSQLTIASCLVSEGGEWMTVSSNKNGCSPLTFEGKLVAARAKPNVKSGEECLIVVTLNGLGRDPITGKPTADVSIKTIGEDGSATPLSGSQLLKGNWTKTNDYEMIFKVKLPSGLSDGTYWLDVQAVDRVGEKKAATRIPFGVGRTNS